MDIFVDEDLRWLVELVVQGRNVQEHIDRITVGGRYYKSTLPSASRCVEFFMPGSTRTPLLSELHMQVFFAEDFKLARVVFLDADVEKEVAVELKP